MRGLCGKFARPFQLGGMSEVLSSLCLSLCLSSPASQMGTIIFDTYFKLGGLRKAWWQSPLCDSEERHSTETRKLSLLCGDSSVERWLAFSLWPFLILLKYNWDIWEKRFSLVEENQGNLCALVGEGRLRICHEAALGCSLESFQVINGEQSGDNISQASQNAIFWNGGLITW